jgi:hypothetical protein
MGAHRQSGQLLLATLYGGPGDGETVPILSDDPTPHFPYLVAEHQELHWYELHIDDIEHYQYVLQGLEAPVHWRATHERFPKGL